VSIVVTDLAMSMEGEEKSRIITKASKRHPMILE
jgi:hypothetical protein